MMKKKERNCGKSQTQILFFVTIENLVGVYFLVLNTPSPKNL
jgi:hypothetical protein